MVACMGSLGSAAFSPCLKLLAFLSPAAVLEAGLTPAREKGLLQLLFSALSARMKSRDGEGCTSADPHCLFNFLDSWLLSSLLSHNEDSER